MKAKIINNPQILRRVIQLLSLILVPSLFITVFSALGLTFENPNSTMPQGHGHGSGNGRPRR